MERDGRAGDAMIPTQRNDCETAHGSVMIRAVSVAVGVTLGMTDPGGVMPWTCPPVATGIGPEPALLA
jgi:hypothetical protein